MYGLICIQQTFSRASRDESHSSPSRVWQPQSWIIDTKANSTDMESTIRSLELIRLRLILNELFNPIDDGRNRLIELFSPNKKNYEIEEDLKLVRNSTNGDIFEMNLKGKRINEKGLLVFCLDNSERFMNGTWEGLCDYELDHTVESVVANMTFFDAFYIIEEGEDDNSETVNQQLSRKLLPAVQTPTPARRRLESESNIPSSVCPYKPLPAQATQSGGAFYKCSNTPVGRRLEESTAHYHVHTQWCNNTFLDTDNNRTASWNFFPNATSDKADPNNRPGLPTPSEPPSSFPSLLPSPSPSIRPTISLIPTLRPTATVPPSSSTLPSTAPTVTKYPSSTPSSSTAPSASPTSGKGKGKGKDQPMKHGFGKRRVRS